MYKKSRGGKLPRRSFQTISPNKANRPPNVAAVSLVRAAPILGLVRKSIAELGLEKLG